MVIVVLSAVVLWGGDKYSQAIGERRAAERGSAEEGRILIHANLSAAEFAEMLGGAN